MAKAIKVRKSKRKRMAALWRSCVGKATRHLGNIVLHLLAGRNGPLESALIYRQGDRQRDWLFRARNAMKELTQGLDVLMPLAPHAGVVLIWRRVHRGGSVFMVKNVGTADRVARLCVAALLAFLALTTSVEGYGEIVCYIIAAYLALTAILGTCWIYRTLDVDSCHNHGGTYHSGEDVFDGRGGD